MVVLAIIGLLTAILLPAVQSARRAAQNTQCLNSLRQIGLAVQQYENVNQLLPRGNHVNILPYIEQQQTSAVTAQAIPLLLCSAENRRNLVTTTTGRLVTGSNYAYNRGRWGFDTQFESPFYGNYRLDHVKDGLSNTLCASEVKLETSVVRNATGFGPAIPNHPNEFANVSGDRYLNSSAESFLCHSNWSASEMEQVGFTTTFPPNTVIPLIENGVAYDINVVTAPVDVGGESVRFAAMTARSWHGPWVNAVFLDGRARPVSNSIRAQLWRSLSTPSGRELMDTIP